MADREPLTPQAVLALSEVVARRWREKGRLQRDMSPSVMDPDARSEQAQLIIDALGIASGVPLPTKAALVAAIPGVIKQRGGQWLSSSSELVGRGLKSTLPDINTAKPMTQDAGNYLRRSFPEAAQAYQDAFTASGTHTMNFGKDYWPWLQANRPKVVEALLKGNTPEAALNRWVDGPFRKYVLRDMATPEDPIRALAERGVLHFDPGEIGNLPVRNKRVDAGFPPDGLGESVLAKKWEAISDEPIVSSKAGEWQAPRVLAASVGDDRLWIDKLSPDTTIYLLAGWLSNINQRLRFDHLVGELGNALNPQSGLPHEMLLRPNSLQHLSMPQAVEHVAKINAWRGAQKVAAEQARANNAATVLFKEYAENNPKGMRWVELKHPEVRVDALPEGWEIRDASDKVGQRVGLYRKGESRAEVFGKTPEDVVFEGVQRGVLGGELNDALAYEGKAMGHSVGGYRTEDAGGHSSYGLGGWNSLINGRARIFSLRDAKGEPHVTIETASIPDQFGTDRIVQIKGKANRKPNDEYLPFVQDFVRSGKWSSVGDLENTGLIDMGPLSGNYIKGLMTKDEAINAIRGLERNEDFWRNTSEGTSKSLQHWIEALTERGRHD